MNDEYAFPRYANCQARPESGMTLRDYFAAKAMQSAVNSEYEAYGATPDAVKRWAEESYRVADAMLEARK